MTRLLSEDYRMEVDMVEKAAWYEIIEDFSDANLYQTWSYGSVLWGEKRLSHLILKKDGIIVACAQVIIIKAPFLQAGIAYVPGGPLWHLAEKQEDIEILRQMIRALKDEYVSSRHMHLRISAKTHPDTPGVIIGLITGEGFTRSFKTSRTFLVNLNSPLENLRTAMQRQWRNNLKKAEKNGLNLIQGNDLSLYDMFSEIYHNMRARKNFVEHVHINEYRTIQSDLPDRFKMHIMVCTSNGNLCSALVTSAIGDNAVNLLAATSLYDIENRLNSSHLLFWKMMDWAKMQKCTWYDLGGIDHDQNPGGYQFKKGLAGTKGIDTHVFQQFESCTSMLSSAMVTCGEFLKSKYTSLKEVSLNVGT